MADLACVQERYDKGGSTLSRLSPPVYGCVLGWVNRYTVYVGIALVAGGAVVRAVGGGGVGAAAGHGGGCRRSTWAAAGGGGGAATGAAPGGHCRGGIGLGISPPTPSTCCFRWWPRQRLDDNDRTAAADARAGRTPSADEVRERLRRDEESYGTIAQVLLGLGVMGALVILAAFGSQFARVMVKGLSGRYPSLGAWLAGGRRTVPAVQAG